MLALESLSGLVVIDEAQHVPGLFPVLRVLADRRPLPATFCVLGSASPDLVGLASESLAGRIELMELPGLAVGDVGGEETDTLWSRGGLPPSFTAADDVASALWRDNYITTFLERDLVGLGSRVPATTLRRAWTMLAHFHGQLWNRAEFARSMDVSEPTAGRYLDTLTDALVVRQLQPWFANVGKRQTKAPKIFLRDSGLLHRLLSIDDPLALSRHPKVGASWEGFIIEQLAAVLENRHLWHWRTRAGAELDLLVDLGMTRLGFEIKRTSAPKSTRGMHSALADLELTRLVVVYPGSQRFPLGDGIEAVPAVELLACASLHDVRRYLDV